MIQGDFRFPTDHQSSVQHDAGEPSRQGRSALKTSQVEISGYECILDCVFCVFSISQMAWANGYEFSGGKPTKHLLEGFHPMTFGPARQGCCDA